MGNFSSNFPVFFDLCAISISAFFYLHTLSISRTFLRLGSFRALFDFWGWKLKVRHFCWFSHCVVYWLTGWRANKKGIGQGGLISSFMVSFIDLTINVKEKWFWLKITWSLEVIDGWQSIWREPGQPNWLVKVSGVFTMEVNIMFLNYNVIYHGKFVRRPFSYLSQRWKAND